MHKNLDAYVQMDKPEEKAGIESEQDPYQNVISACDVWMQFVLSTEPYPNHIGLFNDDVIDRLLQEAENTLTSRALPRVIEEDKFFPPKLSFPDGDFNQYLGIFYTALLNTGVERLVTPKYNTSSLAACGYRLKRGIMEVHQDMHMAGKFISGGCLVSYNSVHSLAQNASGGVVINLGSAEDFGGYANGGLFINAGTIGYSVFGKHFGFGAKKGVFLSCEGGYMPTWSIKCHGIPLQELIIKPDANTNIHKLLNDRILSLTRQNLDIEKTLEFTQQLEEKINELCTKL